MSDTDAATITVQSIKPKLEHLQQMLEANDPGINNYLRDIKQDLDQYPDVVFKLSDEEISSIYKALQAKTNVVISVKTAKKRGKKNVLDDGRSLGDLL